MIKRFNIYQNIMADLERTEETEKTEIEETESTEEVVDDQEGEEVNSDDQESAEELKKQLEEEKERVKKWKARAKKGKAKAKTQKTDLWDIDLDALVESKIKAVEEKANFKAKYPNADIDEVSTLSDELGISFEEAHIINEHRNGRSAENVSSTGVHWSFRSDTTKMSDIKKKLSEMPGFMQSRTPSK